MKVILCYRAWNLIIYPDDELLEKVTSISVYARVSPKHKVRIVEAFKKKNMVVAMTGDGVNDSPALKLVILVVLWVL